MNPTPEEVKPNIPFKTMNAPVEEVKLLPENFWLNVDKNGPVPEHMKHLGPCWVWKGKKSGKGYGRVTFEGKTQLTHRLSFKSTNGLLEVGKEICHHCDNPTCLNPSHLFQGTHSQNMKDAFSKGRINVVTGAKEMCKRGHKFD